MFALTMMIFIQTLTVNVINICQQDSEIRDILVTIAENNGRLPDNKSGDKGIFNPFSKYQITIETPYSTRYFVVELDGNVVKNISTEHIAAINEQLAFRYASYVYQKSEPGFGFIMPYRYYYHQQGARSMMVFIDCQQEIRDAVLLAFLSVAVGFLTLLVLLVIVKFLSKNALRPVAESIEKQKQFITDAGHELKTPIAIINADVEVMELCDGSNEWLDSIKNQTVRLNTLVCNLVELSKLNEIGKHTPKQPFDLSLAVSETAYEFVTRAQLGGKSFNIAVMPNLKYTGNEKEIRQLVSILCDNAIKYTNEGGQIKLSLYKYGKSICLDLYNTAENLDPKTVSKFFERFYRGDSSRSRETGGYGIGLSIAQAIVHRHKGKIKAVAKNDKEITFKITL